MAGRNVEGVGDPAFVASAVAALANDLLDEPSDSIEGVLDKQAVERLAAALADAGSALRSQVDNLDGAKAAMRVAGEALDEAAAELRAALDRQP
jgi:hypothetical protein